MLPDLSMIIQLFALQIGYRALGIFAIFPIILTLSSILPTMARFLANIMSWL